VQLQHVKDLTKLLLAGLPSNCHWGTGPGTGVALIFAVAAYRDSYSNPEGNFTRSLRVSSDS
jgi:hypothetical protein